MVMKHKPASGQNQTFVQEPQQIWHKNRYIRKGIAFFLPW